MPRKPRSVLVPPGVPQHIILRGNNQRRLFSYASCYFSFLYFLGAASRKFGVPIHALALMTNHIHVVVTPSDAVMLGRFVKSFAQRYAIYRNAQRGSTGKLFEERYTSVACKDEKHLAVMLAYVDLNPVRAGLVREPGEYLWSTYRIHGGLAGGHPMIAAMWTPHDWYLARGADVRGRATRYQEWVADQCAAADGLDEIARESDDRDDEAEPYTRPLRRPDGGRVA